MHGPMNVKSVDSVSLETQRQGSVSMHALVTKDYVKGDREAAVRPC